MKKLLKTTVLLSFLAGMAMSTSVYADDSQPKMLLYISPNEYSHSVLLLTPYDDGYWFEQGPLIEPIAFAALKAKESDLAMCTGSETAETIIRVKPYLFHNPWPGIYYATLVATVYSAGGEALGVYTGKGQQHGPGPALLRLTVQSNISKAYALAMEDLMGKLKITPVAERKKVQTVLPCGIIGSQAEPKFSFH